MSKLFELSEDDVESVLWGDHEDFNSVTMKEIVHQGRWLTTFQQVFKHVPSGTLWRLEWDRGSTEYQDEGIQNLEYYEVVPQEKPITVYVKK